MQGRLSQVDCMVSAVLTAPTDKCWEVVRGWPIADWLPALDQHPVRTIAFDGALPGQVGGTRRVEIGNDPSAQYQFFEQLVGLDDENHTMRWKLVSHPGSVNPFVEASFFNYVNYLRFETISVGNQTYAKWAGSFWTEPHYAGALKATIEKWYAQGLQGIQGQLKPPESSTTPRSTLNETPFTAPPSSAASWDSISASSLGSLGSQPEVAPVWTVPPASVPHTSFGSTPQTSSLRPGSRQAPSQQQAGQRADLPQPPQAPARSALGVPGTPAQVGQDPQAASSVMQSLAQQISGLESGLQQLSGQTAAMHHLQAGLSKAASDLDLRVEQAVQSAVQSTLRSLGGGPLPIAQAQQRATAALRGRQQHAAQLAAETQQLAEGILQQRAVAQSFADAQQPGGAGQGYSLPQMPTGSGVSQGLPGLGHAWLTGSQQSFGASFAGMTGQQLPQISLGTGSPAGGAGAGFAGSAPLSPRAGAASSAMAVGDAPKELQGGVHFSGHPRQVPGLDAGFAAAGSPLRAAESDAREALLLHPSRKGARIKACSPRSLRPSKHPCPASDSGSQPKGSSPRRHSLDSLAQKAARAAQGGKPLRKSLDDPLAAHKTFRSGGSSRESTIFEGEPLGPSMHSSGGSGRRALAGGSKGGTSAPPGPPHTPLQASSAAEPLDAAAGQSAPSCTSEHAASAAGLQGRPGSRPSQMTRIAESPADTKEDATGGSGHPESGAGLHVQPSWKLAPSAGNPASPAGLDLSSFSPFAAAGGGDFESEDGSSSRIESFGSGLPSG